MRWRCTAAREPSADRRGIFLTHDPAARRNYYGERALAGLESLGAAVLNPTEATPATRHVGGLTPEAIESQALETAEQVGALTSGRRPHNAVNAERATRLARFGIDRTTAGGRATVLPAGADARGGGVRTLQSWLPVCRAFTQAADLLNIHSSASARSAKSSTRAVRPVSQLTWTDQPSPGLAWRASK
jgi:hypothetical protein